MRFLPWLEWIIDSAPGGVAVLAGLGGLVVCRESTVLVFRLMNLVVSVLDFLLWCSVVRVVAFIGDPALELVKFPPRPKLDVLSKVAMLLGADPEESLDDSCLLLPDFVPWRYDDVVEDELPGMGERLMTSVMLLLDVVLVVTSGVSGMLDETVFDFDLSMLDTVAEFEL